MLLLERFAVVTLQLHRDREVSNAQLIFLFCVIMISDGLHSISHTLPGSIGTTFKFCVCLKVGVSAVASHTCQLGLKGLEDSGDEMNEFRPGKCIVNYHFDTSVDLIVCHALP